MNSLANKLNFFRDFAGVEITYSLYHPKIQQIEVLKLEKRLDDNLAYLKDAPAEYSTIPFNFQPVILPPGAPVPINTTKVITNSGTQLSIGLVNWMWMNYYVFLGLPGKACFTY